MKKLIALLTSASMIAAPAIAADHATGFVSGTGVTLETGWSQGAGKLIGTGVVAKRAYKTDATIKKGRSYLATVTTANVTQGDLQVVLGWIKHSLFGGDVLAPTLKGATPIASNFDVAATLYDGAVPGISADPNGAFRFGTAVAKYAQDDPMLYNGFPGAAHLHMFMCNTGVNAYSTFKSLRTSGNSLCGKANRSSYWAPALLDGNGNLVQPFFVNVYYKGMPSSNPVCGFPDATHIGYCIEQPNGLRYVAGHNSALPTSSGVMSSDPFEAAAMHWECHLANSWADVDPVANRSDYISIDAVVDAGCPAGAVLFERIEAPVCWDGVRLDSANHRDHMAYQVNSSVPISWTMPDGSTASGIWFKCPTDHPYYIPQFSLQFFWKTAGNATFTTKGFHLSSDEQLSPQMPHGETSHMDYWAAWDQGVLDTWHTNCTEAHRTSSVGLLCNGKGIWTGKGIASSTGMANSISRSRLGWSGPLMGTGGTYTVEIKAMEDGQLALWSNDGFTGEVTAFSLTDITPTNNHTSLTVTPKVH